MNPNNGSIVKFNIYAQGFAPILCKILNNDPAGTLPMCDWQHAAHDRASIPQHVKPSKQIDNKKRGIMLTPRSAPYKP